MADQQVGSGKGELRTEFGVRSEVLAQSFEDDELRGDAITILDYRRMRDNDGTVQMTSSAISNTILGAGFTIQDDPDNKTEEESEELKFIKKNLLEPRWKGGMSRGIWATIQDMLRSYEEGYRVYEVVYRVENGKFILDKLASRGVRDNERDIDLKVDDKGNYIGFQQEVSFKDESINVTIVNDTEFTKALLVNYGAQYGSNYGRPGFKSMWYHFDKAHKGMFLNHVGHELGALKARVISKQGDLTNNDKDVDDGILDAFEHVWQESTIMIDGSKYEVELLELSDANVMDQGKDMIAMHQSQMAMAALVQFLQLGSEGASTGSRALGQEQQSFFSNGLQIMAREVIEEGWNRIIADMVRLNFENPLFPRLVWNPISDESLDSLKTVFVELIKGGNVPDNVLDKITGRAAEHLELEVTQEEIEARREEERAEKEANMQVERELVTEMAEKRRAKKDLVNLASAAETAIIQDTGVKMDTLNANGVIEENGDAIQRQLFPDEEKVAMVDMKRKLDDTVVKAERILANKAAAQRDRIVDQYLAAARAGTRAISAVDVQLQEESQINYSQALLLEVLALLNFGKETAAIEIDEQSPRTPRDIRLRVEAAILRVISKQESDLEFRLQQVAQTGLDAKRPENETRILLEAEYDDFFAKNIQPTVRVSLLDALNTGRAVTFMANDDKIFAYRYTAILDNRTTEFCRDLDGKVFQASDPDFIMLTPPNHFNCRSIWTPILESEREGVEVDGAPEDFPVFGNINRFRDVTSVADLNDHVHNLIEMM